MMLAKLNFVAGILLVTATSGCVSPTPYLDSKFGSSVNAAKSQQVINPEASRNRDPVAGIDGTSANESIGRYHDSFKAPPPTFNIIGVGTSGSGQQ